MNKTVLYDEHIKNGGKIVEFGGYLLPVEYTSIALEHKAVREDVGVFDVSHMGEIRIKGKDSSKFVNYLYTNDCVSSENNKMIYGLMLYENGCVVDDLMAYKYSDDEVLLVVNASNMEKDYEYIKEVLNKNSFDCQAINESSFTSQLALQGPKAKDVLGELTKYDLSKLKLFEFDDMYLNINNKETKFLVSRSGYTGSDGFEIYGKNEDILELFKIFVTKNVTLCGLGCRDTLRFESAMPLYGHEISDTLTPLEAGLTYAIKFEKEFIGRDALLTLKEKGLSKKLVGLELKERGIARGGYEVYDNDKMIGYITTGYMIPNTESSYALAYVDIDKSKIGTELTIKIRKNFVKCVVRNKKFLNKAYVK